MANYARYPLKNQRITQNYNGTCSHKPHSTAKDYRDYPIDEGGRDTSKEAVYPACDEIIIKRVYGVGNRGVNTVFWESTSKVKFADNTEDYLCGFYIHSNDADLKKVKVGNKYTRNQVVCYEGTDGGVGMHTHMSFGKGKLKGNGWIKNSNGKYVLYCTGGAFKPEQILYVDKSFTKVINSGGLKFKDLPKTSSKPTSKSTSKPSSTSFFPKRGYFKYGDTHANIGKISSFMYKKFPLYTSKQALGNTFGNNLLKSIKEFQKRTKIEADGYIGPKTVQMLEKYGFKK